MAKRDYIMLNGQPFVFTNRSFSIFEIGGSVERSITGKAHKDVVTTKCKWSFSFDGASENDVIRLVRIFKTTRHITLIDYDEVTYTVIVSSQEFVEDESARGFYSVVIDLEEE